MSKDKCSKLKKAGNKKRLLSNRSQEPNCSFDILRQAILKYGAPKKVYLDDVKN